MLKHFSLLFTPRETGNLLTHAKLCSVVLEVIEQLGKDYATLLSVQTWESVLKIVLGICDHLFRLPEVECPLAKGLCPNLFRVTMGLWVRSTTQSSEMWDIFKALLYHWRHRKPIISQWISTCTSFTHSILSLLYVFPAPKTTVIFQHNNTTDTIQLEQGLVFFFWFRLLHLLGDLDTIESPEIYHEAMRGVHSLAQLFYMNMDIKNVKLLPPDGNGILHIFAPFLLDAVNIERAGYDEGRAEALHTLLQICTHKATTNFDPSYLASLYRGIQRGVNSLGMLDIVLRTSERLFTHNLKGIRLLVPTYWWALKRALVDRALDKFERPGSETDEKHRNSDLNYCCYRLASYLLSFANIYSNQTFGEVCPQSELFDASPSTKFSELLSLRQVLVSSLSTETTQANLILLINIIFNSIWEDPSCDPGFPVELLSHTLSDARRKTWTPDVNSAVLQAWTDLAQLYHVIGPANPSIGDQLMTHLTEMLDFLFRQKSEPTATQDLIILCYRCINAWIMKGQWIVASQRDLSRDQTTLYKVLSYVFLGLTGRWGVTPGMPPHDPVNNPPIFSPSQEVQNAAKATLHLLLNRVDHYPAVGDHSIISSQKSELDVLNTNSACARAVGVYIIDDRIATVIRHPRDQDGNFITTLFIRDATGRYCWSTTLLYDPLPTPEAAKALPQVDAISPPPHQSINSELQTSILSFLSQDEKLKHERLLPRIEQLANQEKSVLSAAHYHLNRDSRVEAPGLLRIDPEHDTVAARLLLNHLGWNDANNRLRAFFVKDIAATASTAEELRVLFSEIDSIHERHRYTAGVFYVSGTVPPTDNSIFVDQSPSTEFNHFVQSLGEDVSLAHHRGFVGGLHPDVTGKSAIYYANHELELVWHVAPRMSYASLTEQQYKRRLLLEDKVAVIWVERVADFKGFDFVKDSLAHTLLVVTPLCPQLVRIQIIRRSDTALTPAQATSVTCASGPLLSELIVSRNSVAALIRTTVINLLAAHSHYERPHVVRQRAINDFIKKHKNDKAPVQTYYCQQLA